MNGPLLNKVIDNQPELLKPIVDAAYSMQSTDSYSAMELAKSVNNAAGGELFDDLHYLALIRDFSITTTALQIAAAHNKK